MKIAIYTLGCKVNQYETQALERELVARGHELVDFDSFADAYIVNSCTVTAVSDKKSRNALRRARRLNPEAVTAVCGCYAQTKPQELEALGVDIICGTGQRGAFPERLELAAKAKQAGTQSGPAVFVDDAMSRREFEQLPAGGLSGRTRAMLKVEDGCANFCSYCAIPYARGPVRSLPLEAAVSEAERLFSEGYRELVVTGIEISSYGRDLKNGEDLAGLTAALCEAVPEMRIRLGSLEPGTVDSDFCRRLSAYGNLCPHFHLSLQSGCDATLLRMRRKYSAARFYESVRLLRESFPGCAVSTDLIVGFPGEDESEFRQTMDFIEKCAFSSMHIFPYSKRSGTAAASMPGQVGRQEKERRAAEAGALAAKMKSEYLEAQTGSVFTALMEQEAEDGVFAGHAPNYCAVRVRGKDLAGRLLRVRAVRSENGYLICEAVDEQSA